MNLILLILLAQATFSGGVATGIKTDVGYTIIDTTDMTRWVMDQVASCGTDREGCIAGFARVCAIPPADLPSNCNIDCSLPNGSISCNWPLARDASGVWRAAKVK